MVRNVLNGLNNLNVLNSLNVLNVVFTNASCSSLKARRFNCGIRVQLFCRGTDEANARSATVTARRAIELKASDR
jgi:hypothetical protein